LKGITDKAGVAEIIQSLENEAYQVYAPVKTYDHIDYEKINAKDIDNVILSAHRATTPLKKFFFKPKEVVTKSHSKVQKTAILGIKHCDLYAINILDKLFMNNEFEDPNYKEKRDNALLIVSDCYSPLDVCFCTILGFNPYVEDNYDLEISSIDENEYFISTGSEKGERVLKNADIDLKQVPDEIQKLRQEKRQNAIDVINKANEEFTAIRDAHKHLDKNYDKEEIWKELMEHCVECVGCSYICPTCHCYILDDLSDQETFKKVRNWDACVYCGYARVAGGESPRDERWQRCVNRFLCKFEFLVDNFNQNGCIGCGRCIQACQGKIDIREIFQKLLDKSAALKE
jgi:ferredoxin